MALDPWLGPDPRQGPVPRLSRASAAEVVRWPCLAPLLPIVPLLPLALSALEAPQRQALLLLDATPVVTRPFRLDSSWLGSPRLDLTTDLPANSSAVVLVDLLNAEGRPVLSLSKDAWRERETWTEDGVSGTEESADVEVPLDLRPERAGTFRLRVALEDGRDAAGQPLTTPLRASLRVRNHSLDVPLILATAATGGLMAPLLWASVYGDCRRWWRLRGTDGAMDRRLVVGGTGLLRLRARARYAPRAGPMGRLNPVPLRLRIEDRIGRPRLDTTWTAPLRPRQSRDGDSCAERLQLLLLRMGERDSLRFRIEVPESLANGAGELEWLELVVEDGVVVRDAWKVSELTPRPAEARRQGWPAPESVAILGLAMAAVLSGSLAAATRPGLYRLGQDGAPAVAPGVTVLGGTRSGRWRSAGQRPDWSRFPGRGPGAAK
jgi:hypothetical protein